MRKSISILAIIAAFVLALGVASSAADVSDSDDSATASQDEELVFEALAQYVGTGQAGQTPVTITIDRLSAPGERDALEEIFLDRGMQALADAMRDTPPVGSIDTPRMTIEWDLRYSAMYEGPDNSKIIRLATDRPISFREAMQNSANWTWDYNVSLIELSVDANGEGEGVLYTGVEFGYDQAHDMFTIKSMTSQPIRLTNVEQQFTETPNEAR